MSLAVHISGDDENDNDLFDDDDENGDDDVVAGNCDDDAGTASKQYAGRRGTAFCPADGRGGPRCGISWTLSAPRAAPSGTASLATSRRMDTTPAARARYVCVFEQTLVIVVDGQSMPCAGKLCVCV